MSESEERRILMTEKTRNRKLQFLFIMNTIRFASFTALSILAVTGALLSLVVNFLYFHMGRPILLIPGGLFFSLAAVLAVSFLALLIQFWNKKWKQENEKLSELIQKTEQAQIADSTLPTMIEENCVDRIGRKLRFSLSCYLYLFLRDRYRQLGQILKIKMPPEKLLLVVFLLLPLIWGSVSFGQQIYVRSFGPERIAYRPDETLRYLEECYRAHGDLVQKTDYSDKNRRYQLNASGLSKDGGTEFSMRLNLNPVCKVESIYYSMEVNDALTIEENYETLQALVEAYHRIYQQSGVPGHKKGYTDSIEFPEEFYQDLQKCAGKEDLFRSSFPVGRVLHFSYDYKDSDWEIKRGEKDLLKVWVE